MKEQNTLDVSHLPGYAFGHRSLMWWGTLGIILIEGTMFILLIATYFYLRNYAQEWPPNLAPPDLFYGTLNTVVLLLSGIPNQLYKQAAEKEDLVKVRIWLLVSIVFAIAFIVIRVFEFGVLHCSWDTNAYGSAVWTLLGFHTTHLVTDFLDTLVLTALLFTNKVDGKRFVDVSENAFYWWFVVLIWLPIYVVLYWVPRWL
jgi:cytochrome c oxidase subunit III